MRFAPICLLLFAAPAISEEAVDARAVEAYRAGDHESARTLWIDALDEVELDDGRERGRILYDLGNAAYRLGDRLEAVGWYTAALRYVPRDSDLWANLELARAELELEPADRGDLKATVGRLITSLTRAESDWLALTSWILVAACLAGEALRGGLVWRRLSLSAVALAMVAHVPLGWHVATAGEARMMVVDGDGAQGRSEPRPDGKRLDALEPGLIVDRLDALPGWVRVETDGGVALWVQEGDVFDLVR